MKLKAINQITDGKITYKAGDVFDTSSAFPESLVTTGAAEYLIPIVDEVVDIELPEDLTELTISELKDICKKIGLSGYSNKREAGLIAMIENAIEEE